MPWVNLSIACARLGDNTSAERALARALQLDPNSAVAKFNLALLMAEKGQPGEAEKLLREALKTDPEMSQAAYNLGILLAGKGDCGGGPMVSARRQPAPGGAPLRLYARVLPERGTER